MSDNEVEANDLIRLQPTHEEVLHAVTTTATMTAEDFQLWLTGHDLLMRRIFIGEESEREYTYKSPNGFDDDYAGLPTSDLEEAREVARRFPNKGDLLERRPASRWVPAKQEG